MVWTVGQPQRFSSFLKEGYASAAGALHQLENWAYVISKGRSEEDSLSNLEAICHMLWSGIVRLNL